MMRTLMELGRILPDEDVSKTLVQNPKCDKILAIIFNEKEDNFTYERSEIQDSQQDFLKYGYRKSSSGPDYTPSSKKSAPDSDKYPKTPLTGRVMNNKIIPWLDKNPGPIANQILLQIKSENIMTDIEQQAQLIDKKDNCLLSIAILKDNKLHFPYEINEFRNALVKTSDEKFDKSIRKGTCAVCHKNNVEITGDFALFKFTTFDKLGFIQDMKLKNKNKMFPVCKECTIYLDKARKFIERSCTYSFCNTRFFAIPKPITSNISDLINIIEESGKNALAEQMRLEARRKEQTGKKGKTLDIINKFTQYEYTIMDIMQEKDDTFAMDFIFYKDNGKSFRILAYVQEISPSRIKRMFNAKKVVDKTPLFENDPFYFNRLQKSLDNDTDHTDLFLNYLQSAFESRKMDSRIFIQHIMKRVKDDVYSADKKSSKDYIYLFHNAIRDGLSTLLFLDNLNVFDLSGGMKEMKSMNEDECIYDEALTEIFGKRPSMLEDHAKRAIFFSGILANEVLYVQNAQLGNDPFKNKFKDFRLSRKDIQRLLPEMQSKLEAYDQFNMKRKKLAAIITANHLAAGDDWEMNPSDIGFYFALGMDLSYNLSQTKALKDREIAKEE